MKYRVMIDLAFDNEIEARAIFAVAKASFKRAKRLSEMEGKRVNIHKCYHDETPAKSCEPIEEVVDA